MTLIVQAYRRGADDELEWLDATPPHNDLAGPESWRGEVYGSPMAVGLGLTLLTTLREADIFAEGESLQQLQREVELLLLHLPQSIPELADSFAFRARNILAAIRRALSVEEGRGGVYLG